MDVEIVAVGTELLLGQTVNGNAAWLGARLAEEGHGVTAHQAVPDTHEVIVDALRLGLARAGAVIVTGGLGPTADDLTREAIAEVAGVPMAFDDDYARALDERWRERFGTDLPVSNFRQAEYPEGADRLANRKGTAPGLWVDTPDGPIAALPGVPPEMEMLFDEQVLPRLRRLAGWEGVRRIRILRTWGMAEAAVGEILEELFDVHGNPAMALLASDAEIKVRLVADAPTAVEADALIAPVEAEVRRLLGRAVFGTDDDTVESLIHRLLAEAGWVVGVAESLTGGLVTYRLTERPGASDVVRGAFVVYDSETKADPLGVSDADLAEGVVSERVAAAMAVAATRRLGADVGLALTGVAGPGPHDGVEAGTVCIGVATPDRVSARTIRLPGDRERVRRYAATAGLHHLRLALEGTWWRE